MGMERICPPLTTVWNRTEVPTRPIGVLHNPSFRSRLRKVGTRRGLSATLVQRTQLAWQALPTVATSARTAKRWRKRKVTHGHIVTPRLIKSLSGRLAGCKRRINNLLDFSPSLLLLVRRLRWWVLAPAQQKEASVFSNHRRNIYQRALGQKKGCPTDGGSGGNKQHLTLRWWWRCCLCWWWWWWATICIAIKLSKHCTRRAANETGYCECISARP